ncbi:aminoglycoside phosphotransferase (plasmid) [halophilic archaeon DL31]|nr:aminoglycoside phosphotransferase [halophilic archaeon DL31]
MTDHTDDYADRLVDENALRSYLRDVLGPANEYAVERHPAGHSNETLFVTWGDRDLVARRPPPGETADTAHDVLREYRVVDALQPTGVPVPETMLACEDHAVLGSDFYVMGRLSGDVLRSGEPDRFADPAARHQIGERLVDALTAIHDVDYEAVGLSEFGHPASYTDRQVERWTKQLDWAFERTREVRSVPELNKIGDWLADNVPNGHEHALLHGDFKLDNVMFGPGEDPELVGVFDWELSTLGDPLTDLGWLLLFWRDQGDPEPSIPSLMPRFLEAPGYPTRADLVTRYESRSGRSFEHDRFYRALAAYKMAALGEMFFRRHLEDNADDQMYPTMETGVPALAERAERIVAGEESL